MGKHAGFAGLALALLVPSMAAQALDYQFDDFNITFKNHVSVGAAMRTESPSNNLLGKLNVPGQQTLCQADDCVSFTGDPTPNERLVKAAGSFFAGNADNGDMNYKKYSVVNATSLFDSDFKVHYHDWLLRVRGIGFFDPINSNFEETHNNTLLQSAHSRRDDNIHDHGTANIFARNVKLYEAYLQYSFQFGERHGVISVGNQNVRWGESTLVAVNSISEINPPNEAILHLPGSGFNQIFQPVPLVLLSTDVVNNVTADFIYQLDWQPVQPDAAGSFLSTSDIAGGGSYVTIGLGQFVEDPNRQYKGKGVLGLLSKTTFTVPATAQNLGYPKNAGQYGMKLNYSADWLNGGTELGFYFLNYHSRLPYLSAFATAQSCARNPNVIGATAALNAAIDCNGFNGSLHDALAPVLGLGGLAGKEPAPIDTTRLFLDYPENVHLFGISFNTNVGSWSLAGEYSYRPNLPLQIQYDDVIFAALQPSLPYDDTTLAPQLINGTPNVTLPGSRTAFPDFLSRYRGWGVGSAACPTCGVQAHQLIRGWQRFKVGQFDFTGIKVFSQNPFGASQIIWIAEAGGTQVFNMPSLDRLQIEGVTLTDTHRSRGADGTGPAAEPNPDTGVVGADTSHFTPTYQTTGFATRFAWGLRSIIQMEYDNVVFGWNFKPQFLLAHDMTGIAPYPNQNFIQGTSQIIAGTDIQITQNLVAHVQYQWFFGSAKYNMLIDRDNVALSLGYSF